MKLVGVIAASLALLCIGTSHAASRTWTGAAGTLWSSPGNWQPSGVPANGDVLTFPAGAANTSNTNDLNGLTLDRVDLAGDGYVLGGNGIMVMTIRSVSSVTTTLQPGAYTSIVSGVGATTGVGIVEVFDADQPEVPLVNISTRSRVSTGDNVMIAGFVIYGNSAQAVVVRARGPSLTAQGVPNALADPVLTLYSGQNVIASNGDWQTASNAAELQSSGFAPADANEAAILITLNPGAYTAIESGAGGGTGMGIIEVFAVP